VSDALLEFRAVVGSATDVGQLIPKRVRYMFAKWR
jgi:hypothetical protein